MPKAGKVVYTSRVRIERKTGPIRLAYLPAEKEPVVFGVHSEIAGHYQVPPGAFPAHATTERVHRIHADHCPVARSLRGAIEIQTSFELIS